MERIKTVHATHSLVWCCVWALCGWFTVSGTANAQDEYNPDWARNFRVGMLAGFNIKTDFRLTGSSLPVATKPGIYDDGYVIPDPNVTTGDATSNWGYNNSSQFDGAHTVTMHQTTSYTPTSGGKGSEDDSPYLGFDMEYGDYLWRWDRVRLGFNFGFGLLPIKATDNRTMNATVNRSIFTFDTGTHNAPFPQPGYQGTPNGGFSINSTPTLAGSDSTNSTIVGSRTLDVTLYTFRLGPTLFWDVNQYIGFAVGAGPAMGLVSGEYRFDETVTTDTGTARNKGHFNETDVVFGGYVNATITYHTVENGDFYLSAQYMPLGTSTFSGGGREAKLDLSGAVYVSAGINWPF